MRSTQRLAFGDVGGGVVALTWPAELVSQARYVYDDDRYLRLLQAASEGGWDVDVRPHLAFWNAPASQRVYMNPTIGLEEYVARWAGPDGRMIGQHEADTVRSGLWPWLLEAGHASPQDEPELADFLRRLGRRPAHLRPALRLLHSWSRDEVAALREQGNLVPEIRAEVNRLLDSVGDPRLPVR